MTNLFNNFIFLNSYSSAFSQQTMLFFSTISRNTSSNFTFDINPNNYSKKGFPSTQIYLNADKDKLEILMDNKRKTGIYLWTHNESGNTYVGSAIDLSKRLSVYYSMPTLINKKNYIYKALLFHGYSSFTLMILEYINISNLDKNKIKDLILEREQYYIDTLNPEYNILKVAGNSLGYKHLEESLIKMSGSNNPMFGKTGENNPFFGKTHSIEALEKMRKPKSNLHKIKLAKINIGRTHLKETLLKMSEAKKGENHPNYGKVAYNAKNIYIYSLDNKLIKECSSISEAARWLNTYPIKVNKYISTNDIFDNKYIIRDNIYKE